MKYLVKLDWRPGYEFEDGDQAIRWAEMALGHMIEYDNVEKKVTIIITDDSGVGANE